MNQLEQLKRFTTVVADTGDIQSIKLYKPQDATTNPSLILAAAKIPEYRSLIDEAIAFSKSGKTRSEQLSLFLDKVFVNFGIEILKIIPGRVSTEVDARLSFDSAGTVQKAHQLIALYESAGIPRERILIKVASTWEGAAACRILENSGIHCNMTLLFSLPQAIVCGDAGATLVSPFVGRILDWYKKNEGRDFTPSEDPGVRSVKEIYTYFKHFGYKTEVMGASFRNIGEIQELAGCDLLTISPHLLAELENTSSPLPRKLDKRTLGKEELKRLQLNEQTFRWLLNENAMATEKLSEGIRLFSQAIRDLEKLLP